MHTCPAPTSRRTGVQGFTLIELMIAVVVVGILAAVALPSFLDSIRKSRRSEAFTALSAVQQAQERYRSNNAVYASSLSALGLGSLTPTTSGYYDIAVSTASATARTAYVATATAKTGTTQVNDAACAKLGVEMSGGTLNYAGASSSGSLVYGTSSTCWPR
jgi:type IV pilus assembly protein PilE